MWQQGAVWDTALDRSIYFSFDRSGFQTDMAVDSRGKVFLVTEANSGLGSAIAGGRETAAAREALWDFSERRAGSDAGSRSDARGPRRRSA